MNKRKKTRSNSKREKREDEPPDGPIIILEPKGPGLVLLWSKDAGRVQLAYTSQSTNATLRCDFFHANRSGLQVEVGKNWVTVDEIRAATADGARTLRVRSQGIDLPLVWQLTQGLPLTSTLLAPTGAYSPTEVPLDLAGFETLAYLSGQSWAGCNRFRFTIA